MNMARKPTKQHSIEKVVDAAKAEDKKTRLDHKAQSTLDSFVNFQMNLGIGADNALSSSNYGFNPITRNRTQLEWIHRGSWVGLHRFADRLTAASASSK